MNLKKVLVAVLSGVMLSAAFGTAYAWDIYDTDMV